MRSWLVISTCYTSYYDTTNQVQALDVLPGFFNLKSRNTSDISRRDVQKWVIKEWDNSHHRSHIKALGGTKNATGHSAGPSLHAMHQNSLAPKRVQVEMRLEWTPFCDLTAETTLSFKIRWHSCYLSSTRYILCTTCKYPVTASHSILQPVRPCYNLMLHVTASYYMLLPCYNLMLHVNASYSILQPFNTSQHLTTCYNLFDTSQHLTTCYNLFNTSQHHTTCYNLWRVCLPMVWKSSDTTPRHTRVISFGSWAISAAPVVRLNPMKPCCGCKHILMQGGRESLKCSESQPEAHPFSIAGFRPSAFQPFWILPSYRFFLCARVSRCGCCCCCCCFFKSRRLWEAAHWSCTSE